MKRGLALICTPHVGSCPGFSVWSHQLVNESLVGYTVLSKDIGHTSHLLDSVTSQLMAQTEELLMGSIEPPPPPELSH